MLAGRSLGAKRRIVRHGMNLMGNILQNITGLFLHHCEHRADGVGELILELLDDSSGTSNCVDEAYALADPIADQLACGGGCAGPGGREVAGIIFPRNTSPAWASVVASQTDPVHTPAAPIAMQPAI